MATKTTLTPFSEQYIGGQRAFWLVASDIDAAVFTDICHGGAVISLDNNESLNTWTPSKGLGDWDSCHPVANFDVYVAFPPALRVNKKVQALMGELQIHVEALGGKFYVLDLPNGKLVAEAFHGATVTNIDDLIKQFNPAFGKADTDTSVPLALDATHSDYLFGIADKNYYFCRSEDQEYFLLPKTSEFPNLAYMVGEADLRNQLYRSFRKELGNVAGSNSMSSVMEAFNGECAASPYKLNTAYRSAKGTDGNFWMDLGTESGHAVKFNADGWELVSRVPNDLGFAFRRSGAIAPLPIPASISAADAEQTLRQFIRQFVNVSDEEWPLLVAFMVTHMIPGFKRPIMLLTSEAQSGKTTATAAVKFAVEGEMDRGKEIPTKPDDLAVTMASQRMAVYNNISNISPALSDFLCQVVDGSEYSKRKLRTDSDVVKLKLVSSIIVNGIDTGELRSDFKTRTVRLELKPVSGESMADGEIDAALMEAHPQILGSLLTLAVEALKVVPALDHPGNAFRMLDYTRVLMAIDSMWGLGGRCLEVYKNSLDTMSEDALDDPIFECVSKWVLMQENKTGEAVWEAEVGVKTLIKDINNGTFSKAMESLVGVKHEGIKNGAALAAKLNRAKTDWKRHGVTFDNLGQKRTPDGKQTVYRFRFEGAEWSELVPAM